VPNRRSFLAVAAGGLLPMSRELGAQVQIAPRRIGFLTVFTRADSEVILGLLRTELEKLGWTDGRNIALEFRTTEGRNELLLPAAAELVAKSPEIILVQTVPATRALMQATKSIPIVMVSVGNPVEHGIVADYRKPGGNVTGSIYPADEAARKLLQLLKEAAPRLRSVAVFTNPSNEAAARLVRQMRVDTLALGMQVQIVEVLAKADFEAAFAAIRRADTESILLPPEPLILSGRDAIAAFAKTHGLPLAVVGVRRSLPASGLIAFAPARAEYAQIAARFVDRILKGAKPGDLPIEQPTRFELVINLQTARALGLTIPQTLLLRADEVIQ
jgi:putative tryptophan/tyrosine transport system substrate-binding protein